MIPSELGSVLSCEQNIHHTSECDDSLLVVCQILHPYEEQLLSTFYFLLNPPGSAEMLFTLSLHQMRLWAAVELMQPTETLNNLFRKTSRA